MDRGTQKPTGGLGVLIVDADQHDAVMLSEVADEAGFKVVGVASGSRDALRLAEASQPTVALIDHRLPSFDGVRLAGQIRQEHGVPSVIVSKHSDPEHLSRVSGQGEIGGVYGYVLKPLKLEMCRVAVEVALHLFEIDRKQMDRIEQLEESLRNRRTVERAKWAMVSTEGISEPEAHERLQKKARSERRTLISVACEILGEPEPDQEPPHGNG